MSVGPATCRWSLTRFGGQILNRPRRVGISWGPVTGTVAPRRRRGRSCRAAWASMPHCRQWSESDWQFAYDSPELAASAFTDGAKVGLATELRYREKVMATTWSSRQDARIPYTAPAAADGRSASVTEIDLYRNL
jgi:hypothetical protein